MLSPNQVRLGITKYLPYDVPDYSGGANGSFMLAFETLAQLAAYPSPATRTLAYVAETDAVYLFIPGDATPADVGNWTICTSATGRWFIRGDAISIAPIGGGADDNPRIKSAAVAVSAAGVELRLRSGVFTIATSQNLITAQGLTMRGAGFGKTILNSTMAPSDGHTNSPIYVDGFSAAAAATTLNGSAARGAKTINVVSGAAVPTNSEIAIVQGANVIVATYDVTTAANVLTLDRPLLKPFANGSDVRRVTFAKDFAFLDMTITGTGDRGYQICAGRRVRVRLQVRASMTSFAGSLDSAPYKCTTDDTEATFVANCSNGLAIEFAEACDMISCRGLGAFLVNNTLVHMSDACDLFDPVCRDGARAGLQITSDPTNTLGSHDISIFGGSLVGNALGGAEVTDGSSDVAFVGTLFADNFYGASLTPGVVTNTASDRTTFTSCEFLRNNTAVLMSASTGNRFVSCHTAGQTAVCMAFLTTGGAEYIDSVFDEASLPNFGSVFSCGGTGIVKVIGGSTTITSALFADCFTVLGATSLSITDFRATRVGGGTGAFLDVADAIAARISVSGATTATSFATGLTMGTLACCRLSGSSIDIGAIPNNGRFNRGSWTANGVAPVAIAFLAARAGDRLFWSTRVAVGAYGTPVPGAVIVGTGFAPISIATDQSTYDYEIT